ncbi:MAG: hypothetical protein KIS87_12160 [Phycisphaeraceae bacterium]|nr:hypothetical protein [Phycisphaeraceae bacterium]
MPVRARLMSASVVDARNRRVRLLWRSATTAKERWRMHAELSRSPRAKRAVWIAFALALPTFALPALLLPHLTRAMLGSPPSLEAWRIALVIVAGASSGAPGPLVMILVARRMYAAEIARFVVGAGACASCDYPLAGVPEADVGCTVCPACGAAWRRMGEAAETRA